MFVCVGRGFCFVCVCVCLSFSFRVSVCRFMFWCIVRFSSFDCVFASFFCFLFPFFCVRVFVFCFQFSLPITKYFVCLFLLITGCFCLRSRVNSPQQKCCFVGEFLFALWMVSFSMTLGRCCVHCLCFFFCVCVCGCCLLILSHLNIWINVLDFLHCFSMIFLLLFCLECKSSRVFFLFCSHLSTSFSLFLCYFCFNLSGCLFSLKLTC